MNISRPLSRAVKQSQETIAFFNNPDLKLVDGSEMNDTKICVPCEVLPLGPLTQNEPDKLYKEG